MTMLILLRLTEVFKGVLIVHIYYFNAHLLLGGEIDCGKPGFTKT